MGEGLKIVACNSDAALKLVEALIEAGVATQDLVCGIPVVLSRFVPPETAYLIGGSIPLRATPEEGARDGG